MLNRDRDYALCLDIVDYGSSIIRLTTGRTMEDMDKDDDLLGHALRYKIAVIGEAASHISAETRSQFSAIPWRQIIALRNIIVHDYANTNDEILWTVATESVPALIAQIELILPALRPTDSSVSDEPPPS